MPWASSPRADPGGEVTTSPEWSPIPICVGIGNDAIVSCMASAARHAENRVPIVGTRCSKDSVKSVPKRVEDVSTEPSHHLRHRFDRGLNSAAGRFRVEVRNQFSRADDVGKKHSRLLALALRLHERFGIQWNSAVEAEPVAWSVLFSAVLAFHCKTRRRSRTSP